jgi:hypothetical protein
MTRLLAVALTILAWTTAAIAADFYVAPIGDDANPGSQAKPFATLFRARDAVRASRKAGQLAEGPVVIHLRGGDYRITKTLELNREDFGGKKSPVIWEGVPGERIRLLGGIRLSGWMPVADPGVLARLDRGARDKVVQVDLRAMGVTDLGVIEPKPGRRAELFCNDRYMTLARYPNEGWLRIADVPQKGELKFPGDFRNSHPTTIDGKLAGRHYGRFSYDGDRPQRWKAVDDLYVHGFWVWDYSEQYHRVERLDTATKEVWPKPPYHFYGYHKGARYYFLNVLEELDSPGEWYLDRKSGILYFWPPENIATAEITFPLLGAAMLSLKDVADVQIRGITFECSRSGAITIDGGADNLIEGCTFRNLGDTAIRIESGARHGVRSCDIDEVGAGGIVLNAGNRKTLSPGRCFVENCHIHDFGRVVPASRPAVNLGGVGNRVAHCWIHDCPNGGLGYAGNDHVIEFCEFARTGTDSGDVGTIYTAMDWTYRGHVIRHNYFHDIHSPERVHVGSMTVYLDLPCGGVHLYGNVFCDMQRAFFTNSGRDCLIENNIFVKCNPSIQFNSWPDEKLFREGGAWRMVERLKDVCYDRPPYSTRYPELLRLFKDGDPRIPRGNIVRRNVSCGGRFIELQAWITPDDVKVENNLIADPVALTGTLNGQGQPKEYRNEDPALAEVLGRRGNVLLTGDAGLVDPGAEDFTIRPDSPAWKLGFQPIPFDRIGLRIDAWRKSLPLRAPIIQAEPGPWVDEVEVRIAPPRRGSPKSVIRYTLDGTEPRPTSSRYASPLKITRTITLKAAAFPVTASVPGRPEIALRTFTLHHLGSGYGIYLSDLPARDVLAHGGLKIDENYHNDPIRLGDQTFAKGLLLCPEATREGGFGHATFDLDGGLGKATRFKAVVGIEHAVYAYKRGSSAFIVEVWRNGEWDRVFESPVLRFGQARVVDVDIVGAQRIRLITTDGGDGINSDHAAWADAKLQ